MLGQRELFLPQQESDDDAGECVLKGKSTSLSQFFRVARNLMSMVFKNGEPEVGDVEEELITLNWHIL